MTAYHMMAASLHRFNTLLDMLYIAFSGESVSEKNYHDIVKCMRACSDGYRPLDAEEKLVVTKRFGMGAADYNPFEHFETVRYGMTFGSHNAEIDRLWESAVG